MLHQSQIRLIPAAEEILSILKIISDLDTALRNPIMAFSMYMSALIFLEDFTMEQSDSSKDNLVFLLNMAIAMGDSNPVVRSLAHQLAVDMKLCGIDSPIVEQVGADSLIRDVL